MQSANLNKFLFNSLIESNPELTTGYFGVVFYGGIPMPTERELDAAMDTDGFNTTWNEALNTSKVEAALIALGAVKLTYTTVTSLRNLKRVELDEKSGGSLVYASSEVPAKWHYANGIPTIALIATSTAAAIVTTTDNATKFMLIATVGGKGSGADIQLQNPNYVEGMTLALPDFNLGAMDINYLDATALRIVGPTSLNENSSAAYTFEIDTAEETGISIEFPLDFSGDHSDISIADNIVSSIYVSTSAGANITLSCSYGAGDKKIVATKVITITDDLGVEPDIGALDSTDLYGYTAIAKAEGGLQKAFNSTEVSELAATMTKGIKVIDHTTGELLAYIDKDTLLLGNHQSPINGVKPYGGYEFIWWHEDAGSNLVGSDYSVLGTYGDEIYIYRLSSLKANVWTKVGGTTAVIPTGTVYIA